MSIKPISISFGKPKAAAATASSSAVPSKPSSLAKISSQKPNGLLYHPDSDPEDEPSHDEATITGFSSSGAVLAASAPEPNVRIIANPGNGDWRKRKRGQRSALPGNAAVNETTRVEVDEVSTASGLQLAPSATIPVTNGGTVRPSTNGTEVTQQPEVVQTDDERALAALLNGNAGNTSTAVIAQQANRNLVQTTEVDEIVDFRADVASRPDSCTLDEYAAMPVEEFGLAMLRGMGAKRKAMGLPINWDEKDKPREVKVREPREGYLGIGAKAQPGMTEGELGAWGKAAMRKGMRNGQGEGMYTPVMLRDKRTGELVSEEDVERRRRESGGKQDDWRDRRDKNPKTDGDVKMSKDAGDPEAVGDDYKKQTKGSLNPVRDGRNGGSSSRRDRSRSGGSRRHEASGRDEQYRDRDRDRRRGKWGDFDSRYDSSSSRRSGGHRDSDREGSRRADGDDRDERRRRDRR